MPRANEYERKRELIHGIKLSSREVEGGNWTGEGGRGLFCCRCKYRVLNLQIHRALVGTGSGLLDFHYGQERNNGRYLLACTY